MSKKITIPEPPEAVTNGDGSALEIWNAIWETRAHFAGEIGGIKAEVRMLAAVVLLLVGAVIGEQL